MQHSKIERPNLEELADAVSKFTAAGADLFRDPGDENVIRPVLGWPELTEDEIAERMEENEANRQQMDALAGRAAMAAAQEDEDDEDDQGELDL
ncbi:MAG: hypothetical protein GWM90_10140 [Gemmatimonadetes bacterium]|nr:hypothetical protein [Gemmatimonadota bacterium]NIQ54303.1 hypothetical protein [Gemmatimonadota bacterium]NIX44463.1 hypothetical protein [Gemmatimonadota bacterium]